MPLQKLTTRTVDAARPGKKLFILYDEELPGFGLRVMPSGFKSWIVEYRPKGAGRSANKKRVAIGSASVLTAAEARRLAKDTLAAIRHGHDPLAARRADRAAISIKDLAHTFLDAHVDKKRKRETAALYRRALTLHVIPKIGGKKAAEIARQDVLRLHAGMADRPVMANRVVAVLSSMFSWAGKAGLIPEHINPAVKVEKNREQGRERFLSTDELERLGAALREAETVGLPWEVDLDGPGAKHLPGEKHRRSVLSPHAVAAVRLLVLTGCRLREILHLRWSEVDFERGMLNLPDSKTGRKWVVLNAPALAVLDEIPRVGPFVVAGQAPKPGKAERPRSDLKKPWSAVRRRAELDGVRIHDLRHSFASVGAAAGLGLPIVGKLLGHSQVSTTQKYAHLDNDPLKRATNAIGATISAAMSRNGGGDGVVVDLERRQRQGKQ